MSHDAKSPQSTYRAMHGITNVCVARWVDTNDGPSRHIRMRENAINAFFDDIDVIAKSLTYRHSQVELVWTKQ